ncbi:hypothetical protein HHL19_35725 [Streptomyces sp. R302]|uniref:hypothetical protein n=1 Tax=unclassified Streptomyces TaxID=2593676 RepID=UPI00145FC75B|nr:MULTISPECIES: hypothetical protein [unclassified Streptomyces]NML55110.1 hypothetical protein [Streptomyces sp. R301]NML83860.1 hypothetical protein [Streptomyces sp. R302]
MQPRTMEALEDWRTAWEDQQAAAQEAFTAAFPALDTLDPRCRCYGPTLRWATPGEGEGKVCLDDHGRATAEFEHVPKAAVGKALEEVFGTNWFDEGEAGFAGAEPGEYTYEDESTYAEYYIHVHETGLATLSISYLKIEDIVVILDALEQVLAEHRTT